MAAFNQIQVGRFNRFLQKLLSMKGPASLESLGPELFPTLNIPSGIEDDQLRSVEHFQAGLLLLAVAGKVPEFQLRNPGTSNVGIVVEYIALGTDQAPASGLAVNYYNIAAAADFAAGTIQNRGLDNRSKRLSSGIFSRQAVNAAGSGGGLGLELLFNGVGTTQVIQTVNQEKPVMPGDALILSCQQQNIDLMCAIQWRERFLEDSERS